MSFKNMYKQNFKQTNDLAPSWNIVFFSTNDNGIPSLPTYR